MNKEIAKKILIKEGDISRINFNVDNKDFNEHFRYFMDAWTEINSLCICD